VAIRRPATRTERGRPRARTSRSRSGAGYRDGVKKRRFAKRAAAAGAIRLSTPALASVTRWNMGRLNDRTIVLLSGDEASDPGI
jgi:hypothetical protein